MYGVERLKGYNHIKFEQELRQLYSLMTFKDKISGEVRFRTKEYIRQVVQSRTNSKALSLVKNSQESAVTAVVRNAYDDRPYSYMQGRRDSLKQTLS